MILISDRERTRAAASGSHMARLPGQPLEGGDRVGEAGYVVVVRYAALGAHVVQQRELDAAPCKGPGGREGDQVLEFHEPVPLRKLGQVAAADVGGVRPVE